MGSFTSLAATQIMRALFPTATTSHTPLTATNTTPAGFRIYNNVSGTASQLGILSAGANVIHSCNLVLGATSASSNPPTSGGPMTDANFASPAVVAGGGITGSTSVAGSLSYPTVAGGYVDYTGMVMVASGGTTHTWQGWSLSEAANKGQAQSNLQIGFPALGAGSTPQNVYGFVISAHSTTNAAPTSSTQLIAATTSGMPVVIAFGDLSNGRQLTAGDTPVFATGAITITLE